MAIRIITEEGKESLAFRSHWWGFPDLPEGVGFPSIPDPETDPESDDEDLLTFICQVNLADIAQYDPAGRLPHSGFLYFFAALDYFLGDTDAGWGPIGYWPEEMFRVIYASETQDLHTHRVQWADGSDACLPAEEMRFGEAGMMADGQKLLGLPFFDEVREEAPGDISLLQIDEDDRWNLRFYDCGMLNFLISPQDLADRRFDKVRLYMHCM